MRIWQPGLCAVFVVSIGAFFLAVQAEEPSTSDPVKIAAARRAADSYRDSAERINRFPIGVFDSGTGGLTILEQILTIDEFDNESHRSTSSGDGKADFGNESFIFLADQANMPYGNYPIVKKEKLLDDLIVKDAAFLMNREYFRSPGDERPERGKLPVKAIVIACNTATAYGQSDIEEVVKQAGIDIKIIGVIDAGAQGAIEVFGDGKPGAIGVVPTQGTVLSGAYPRAIRRYAKRNQLKQQIDIHQQGAFGLAGSIDGAREFILSGVETNAARDDYRGPSLTNSEALIDRRLLKRYDFDFSDNRMLLKGTIENPSELQLNSVENYLAYHLVTLLERVRTSDDSAPLRAVILGCTHFPFYQDAFVSQLARLRNYQEDGTYIYRKHIAQNVHTIDPAYFAARELYQSLAADERFRFRTSDEQLRSRGEFYITAPCRLPGVRLQDSGNAFTYEYKYGRKAGSVESDFRAVPISDRTTSQQVLRRLEKRVPAVWKLLSDFRNSKMETSP